MTTAIPKPKGWPIIGNVLQLSEPDSTARLAAQYGPIFKVSLGTGKPDRVIVCSAELLNEICDEKRFAKNPTAGGLSQVRNLTGDGLFTALDGEENWALAHRILMPVLGPMSIGNMFEDMHELACQLVLKWARLDQTTGIPVTEDFTRLTLDTLALCTMDTRFNSFYSETPHSFVEAMNSFLLESGSRAFRPSFVTDYVYRQQKHKYFEDVKKMREIANHVIERRRSVSTRKKDLVDAMIHEKDPVTGKTLPHDNIINNMITFLIAGHETTSGLLSFLIYLLAKNPNAMAKAREEVMSVLGDGAMTQSMTSKLPYLQAVIRETLRLHPTAPGFSVQPKSSDPKDYPLLIGKQKYPIHQGETIVGLLPQVHRDPTVYGDDSEAFRPERMLDEPFNKLPKNSWKPFGNGARGCIGRVFALQESTIVIALLLQNFDFELYDPNYQLTVRKTLTVKPKGLLIRATLRDGLGPASLQRRLLGGQNPDPQKPTVAIHKNARPDSPLEGDLKDLLICYGSNAGSCQTLAHALSQEAHSHGFHPIIMSMDEAQHQISSETPVVIITASYEGQPPDNAVKFVKWLECLTESPFGGGHHAVYGCGNRDWVDTFQRIPILVDDAFIRCGSIPLVKRATSDAADNNISNEFDQWADNLLWPALAKQYRTEPRNTEDGDAVLEIIQSTRTAGLFQDGGQAVVLEAKTLTAPSEPRKNHMELQLPPGMTYTTGDRLAILPINQDTTVKETMTRFGLALDSKILARNGSEQSVYTFLREYVELNQVATEKNIRTILQSIPPNDQSEVLEKLSPKSIAQLKMSVLGLLQKFPTAALPFCEYLSMLPPLHTRLYSISSSPLAGANTCTLTYSVLNHTAPRPFLGAGSNYLASLRPNDRLWVSVRASPQAFHLPEDPTVAVVMICAGSGLAPFLGFVQERARMIERGVSVARAMLFIGCRHPERDVLYASEMQGWADKGAVELRYAFSRAPDRSQGCRYVQELLWKEREGVIPLVKGSGKIFVCGDTKVLDGVGKAMVRAYGEIKGVGDEEAQAWLRSIRNERFVSEVFG
ncbi:cytochrome P450 [Melanomma pulvis-pyrius CBS 109.77]|uniref:Bifunctional cytochrome P450/NADPH--P450 reductase n=1 Tax=Melanomma pulvis-pyrius CBS 109.77 TaxID=1314802 RepID=A0A6A6XB00_9PLEO|nr:cytochrome P450 [Melanomma pulvis-pyrius CBS 109.77]